MMTRIYFAVELAGALVGDFALVADADLLGDVDALKQRIKASRSRLRDVELGDMTVFGVWGAKPTVAVWKTKLLDGDAALDPADTLGTLIGDMERAYIIVHITAPPPAAATGATRRAVECSLLSPSVLVTSSLASDAHFSSACPSHWNFAAVITSRTERLLSCNMSRSV